RARDDARPQVRSWLGARHSSGAHAAVRCNDEDAALECRAKCRAPSDEHERVWRDARITRFRSIISRVVALHVIAIGATSILMPLALYWLLDQAANSLHRDALRGQAATIASFLRPTPEGGLALRIPSALQALYGSAYGLYAYAVLDSDGKVLFTSRDDGQA